jgi:hypothetical protein
LLANRKESAINQCIQQVANGIAEDKGVTIPEIKLIALSSQALCDWQV